MSNESINPLVYPLLSGLTGALIVFIGGEILRWRREKAYRKSLIALLDEELNLIFHRLKTVDKSTVLITSKRALSAVLLVSSDKRRTACFCHY